MRENTDQKNFEYAQLFITEVTSPLSVNSLLSRRAKNQARINFMENYGSTVLIKLSICSRHKTIQYWNQEYNVANIVIFLTNQIEDFLHICGKVKYIAIKYIEQNTTKYTEF